jgi:hypothetical protein
MEFFMPRKKRRAPKNATFYSWEITGFSAINARILCSTNLQTGVHEFSLLHVVVVEVVDN